MFSRYFGSFTKILNHFNPTSSLCSASYYRDYSHFDRDLFEADLAQIDFCSLVNTKDGNISCNNIIQVLQDITDKHAPIRKVSSSKNKTAKKALDTQRHTYLYKKNYLRRISSVRNKKKSDVKYHNNKLNKIKELYKKKYLSTQFYINKDNIKISWKLIGLIINMKKKTNPRINKHLFNNKCYTDESNIWDQFNTYLINVVGPNLSDQLPKHDNPNPMKYIKSSFPNSFMTRSIHVHEVHNLIKRLKNQKSTIGVPIKCVKLACDYIYQAIDRFHMTSRRPYFRAKQCGHVCVQNKCCGLELFSHVKTLFYSRQFAKLLTT